MEYAPDQLKTLLKSIPGTLVAYKIEENRIIPILYTADAPAFSGLSEEEYLSLYGKDTTPVVLPEDLPGLMPQIADVLAGKGDRQATYRTCHKTQGYIWTHADLRLLGSYEGRPLLLGVFFNITAIIESPGLEIDLSRHISLKQELNEERTKYRLATEGANLRVYEYDIVNHCIHLPEHSRKLFGVTEADIGNIPDSIQSLFQPQDQDRLRDFFRRVDHGEKNVTDEFLMMPVNGMESYLRYTFTTIFEGDKPLKAYAVAEDISAQKRAEADFHKSIQALLSTNPNALCTFQCNLTRNTCGEGHGSSKFIQSLLVSKTADGLFSNILSIIPASAEREQAATLFSRGRLLELFASGETNMQLDYQRIGETGRSFWVRTYISMLKNPIAGDIVGIFYSVDISSEKRQNQIFDIITNQEYDFVALLYASSNKIEFLNLSSKLLKKYHDAFGRPGEFFDFDKVREFAMANWIDKADREYYLKASSVEAVKLGLEKNGHCELSVRGHYTGHPEATMCRKIQHYYLDDEKDAILIIESDVTETYLQEQREAEAARRKLSEQQARTMEETLINTLTTLPVIAVLFLVEDTDRIVPQYCTDSFCHLLGGTQQDIGRYTAGRDGYALLHPDDKGIMRRTLQRCMQDNQPYNAIYRIKTLSEEYKWVSVNCTYLAIGDRHYLYAVHTDIDDLKKQEELFEEQYRSAQAFVDSVSGIYIATRRSNLTRNQVEMVKGISPLAEVRELPDYDASIRKLLEYMPREIDRRQCAEFYSRGSLLKAYIDGLRTLSCEYQLYSPEGNVQWVKSVVTLTKRPGSGDIISFSAVRDISRSKFAEIIMNHMIAKQYDYISCIDAKRDKVILLLTASETARTDTDFIHENSNYEEVMQIYNSHHIIPEERAECDRFMSLAGVRAALKSAESCSAAFTISENDTLRNKKIEFFYIDRESSLIALIRSDYTEMQQKQLEQETKLRTALDAARQANIAKTDFLSRMSHDIRTPLNGIIGMTYLANEQKNPPKTADCLAKIGTSSDFLLGLINDILDMSKAESNRIELHPEPYTAAEFNAYIDAVIRPLCVEKNQNFSFSIHKIEGLSPCVDKLRFNQIFFNLLSNAVKYTPEGGTITAVLYSSLVPDGHLEILARVSDNGIGMSRDFQKVLFDPFTQEGRDDNSRRRGSGLGLAITKKMVDLMGGTITVKSSLGAGSTFEVKLHTDCAHDADIHPAKSGGAEPSAPDLLNGRHILLCEDHPLNQEIAQALLAQKGMIVETAEDGQKGLDAFAGSAAGFYDAILMDIRMPVLDGYAAAKAIRALDRADAKLVPIIAMTADAFADDVQKCLAAGMNAHLAKPIEPGTLYSTLSTALQRRPLQSA